MISICLAKLDEGNSEITMRWHGGYIDNFQMFRTLVCMYFKALHAQIANEPPN